MVAPATSWRGLSKAKIVDSPSLSLAHAQTDTRSPTVFIDEFDPRGFESPPDHIQSGSAWAARAAFQLMDSDSANSSSLSELLLAPRD
jgi:hypothetical protein